MSEMVRRRLIWRGVGESWAGGAGDEQDAGHAVFHAEFLEDSFHLLFDRASVGLQDDCNLRIRFSFSHPACNLPIARAQAESYQRRGSGNPSGSSQICFRTRLIEMRTHQIQDQSISLG